MEDEKNELKILKEVIRYLKLAQGCMASCDNVTETEYQIFGLYIQELEDRAMKLEIDINGCIIQEV